MIEYYGNEITWVPDIHIGSKPIYRAIVESIENDINSGKLRCGFKLPPQRIIANYLGINHSTVTRAYKICEERGLIKGIVGKGTYVSSTMGMPLELITNHSKNNIIEMGMMLPLYEVNQLIHKEILGLSEFIDYDIVMKYSPPEGHIKHRYIVAKWLEQYSINCLPDNIVISSGTQNALSVVLIGLFNKGDRIAVDEFTYTSFINIAKLLGIILIPIKSDGAGIDIVELHKTCRRENIKGIYLIPNYQNPTSITLSEEKRYEISKILDEYDILLIEDDAFNLGNSKHTPIKSLCPEKTIYIHGTAKPISPTFRISYIVAPLYLVDRLKHSLNSITWMASPYTSEILSLLQSTSKYEEITRMKRMILEKRNRITDSILKEFDLVPSQESLFRYLHLPKEVDDADIETECFNAGVQVFSSKRFATGINNSVSGIRIAVSAPESKDEMIRGLNLVRDILRRHV